MSRVLRKALFCFIIFTLISCSSQNSYETNSYYALGTILNITLPKSKSEFFEKTYKLIKKKEDKIKSFYDNFNSSPTHSKIVIDDEIYKLFKKAQFFYNLSEHKFDITIYTLTSLYGFPEGPFKVPTNKELNTAKKKLGFKNIQFDKNYVIKQTDLKIDMGAYAKGYIVDKAIELLKKNGTESAIVDAGGDLFALGLKNGKKWRIAIKHPDIENRFLSIVNVSNKAVVTSGNYERFFITKNGEKIIHIFDATTGKTANNYKSISVIADTTEMADGLSTLFFLLSLEKIEDLCKKYNAPTLVYTIDNKLIKLCSWESYEN
ncbi:FAD:protein FMN transferase [Deferribacter autotrophicus]|uniref:FAD:protein FMN transferase n=1 Tax=Deferribacter autotrophicus TaxID=500465 RepID=A0A5A8F5H4_9BACT|nr:FAD:protein FMN transferase [Deferribacter autotrophicus]KAA0256879.1 FAD:protein FMN transferase [Deferribacter autotrophicus]